MIVLDEKMPPPPPYTPPPNGTITPNTQLPVYLPPFPYTQREQATLVNLPPHLLLRIVYATFTQTSTSSIERQRKTLYWLTISLRLVNRALYVACMHVLRSTYLPAYSALVRPPYSSDPFPLQTTASQAPPTDALVSPIKSVQRETKVLDLFIAGKVREDVWMDESELHLEREECVRDLFDLMQPRSRMEDLVRIYGVRESLIYVGARPAGLRGRRMLAFKDLSVSFSSKRVGLVLTTPDRKKTIVEVEKRREEKLEVAAKALVRELRTWVQSQW